MDYIDILAKAVCDTQKTIAYLREQDYCKGNRMISDVIADIKNIYESGADRSGEDTVQCLEAVLSAQEHFDYVLVADILEMQLLAHFQDELQNAVVRKCEDSGKDFLAGEYLEANLKLTADSGLRELIRERAAGMNENAESPLRPEATNMGCNTLHYCDGADSFYYHSNVNPIKEAEMLADYYAKDDELDYLVFGFGMGYHIEAMLSKDRRFKVTALETDIDVLALAYMHRDLTKILSDVNFKLIYMDIADIDKIFKANQGSLLIMHYPSLRALPDSPVKESLNDYFIKMSSLYSEKPTLDCNFYYNTQRGDKPVDEVMARLAGKSVIFIGGGPSLNDNIEYLKSPQRADKIVVTASTSYRLLGSSGIIPDYVIMIDTDDANMMRYLKDTDKYKSPLIYMCTASNAAVQAYSGEHYIALQHGYEPAENLAKRSHLALINTGGSVTTAAIDMILQAGCRELITMGIDFAYTDNKSHSFDKQAVKPKDNDNMIEVRSVEGTTVRTTHVLDIYRKWVEQRVKSVDQSVSLINVSRGAYISGMRNVTSLD